ncbi:hypothetical protein RN001_014376 [Aquatica leii]|uniref:Peptidase S1 domain-containing protein n=1 Tax=Aquatica leii TaxID=1421715 RepID=A0AAN7PP94_9COLE|nr:hypothetical protein RN001_014376 [Aquatica leii]
MKIFLILLFVAEAFSFTPHRTPTQWKIVGGGMAATGEFPYQISLRINGKHACGGSILNPNTILTAAHCIVSGPESMQVVTGTNLISGDGDVYNVRSVTTHEDYNAAKFTNDIALLHLSSNIKYNDLVQPIGLDSSVVGANVKCVLSGWGLTSYPGSASTDLRYIRLKTISNKACAEKHSSSKYPITDEEVCTYNRVDEGVCRGDSGGPLVTEQKQIGIVSWGKACARGYPDVFTRVSAYVDWIEKNLNN